MHNPSHTEALVYMKSPNRKHWALVESSLGQPQAAGAEEEVERP